MIWHRIIGHRVTRRQPAPVPKSLQFPFACHTCRRMGGWLR